MRVFVRRWVGGDEFGAGVGEEFFEGGDAFLSNDDEIIIELKRGKEGISTNPRDILANCSP